jgi:cyclohexyl-isocyanide hydratase
MQVNMMILPEMVALDLIGPHEVLARVPGWTVDLVAADMNPVRSDKGMGILPTVTRETAKPSDILVVPGGSGADIAMLDSAWLDFTRTHAAQAKYVFGICTGAFVLGAAGLLKGRRAGAHWQARDLLSQFGAIPSDERIVIDGTYYTSGGVTSGIDAALRVVGDIEGEDRARMVQLALEYDPAPPFEGGTPFTSPARIVEAILGQSVERRAKREKQVAEAAARL